MRFLLSLILLISVQVLGAELQLPSLTSPVMDLAGMMNEAERKSLSDLAYEINTNNGPQITVLTVPDMQGYPIEDFSIRVAEKWQLGTKEKDNGLLIVIAKAERQMRIEVGGGIEGEITDYDTAQYTRRIFPEYFKRGEFYGGLRLFMEDVAKRFNIKLSVGGNRYVRRAPARTGLPGGNFLFIAVIGILVFGSILFRKPGTRGLFNGVGFSGLGLLMGASIPALVLIFIVGLILGVIGLGNLLTAILMSGRGGYGGGGGFGGGGGGGWSGGGGGFSGGGSSGSW